MKTSLLRFRSMIAVLLMAAAQVTSAAAITVNTTADNTTAGDGQCTLREALANVNAAADTTGGDCTAGTGGGDTVAFNLTLPATIKLTVGELVIGQDVTILGPTDGSLRLRAAQASRVLNISAGTTAAVSDLTIERGRGVAMTGCTIRNNGTLVLTNCTFKKNGRTGYGNCWGGAIYNDGILTLTNCLIKQNKADVGGGIRNANGAVLTATNTTFEANRARCGGAIASAGSIVTPPAVTLTNCTFTRNRSRQCSGGIQNHNGAVTLSNCTLANNKGNAGGAIQNIGGMVALTNCTFQGNEATPGTKGGLGGGAIWHDSLADSQEPPGTAVLINTIVAGSGASTNCGVFDPVTSPITSNGHNLSSDGTCFTSGGTDLLNADPMLAPLVDYGGPTQTLALCSGAGLPHPSCTRASPAIDAGDDAVTGPPDNLTTDQRGLPRQAGVHVDIGAYEVQ